VKTLHYYDQIGLLKPAKIDRFTGYRYYTIDQLSRLNRILASRDLGFTLEHITTLLDKDLLAAQIRGMLRMRQVDIHQQMEDMQTRLRRVDA
jgi:DNA-binding transcriptional MerR regulator